MPPENDDVSPKKLSLRLEEFCQQFLYDRIGAKAAKRMGVPAGSARMQACRWLALPEVQARIAELDAERRERLKIDGDDFVRELVEMVRVDINEIVEHRRVNCRHCWGVNHAYQWTAVEFTKAQRRHQHHLNRDKNLEPPDEIGGIGFDATRDPNPKCPECRGDGEAEAFFKDSRHLSPAARRLYDGMQVSKDGKKTLIVGREKLLEMIGRALGVFKDKVELTGKDGGPIETVTETMTVKEAAEAYAATLNKTA